MKKIFIIIILLIGTTVFSQNTRRIADHLKDIEDNVIKIASFTINGEEGSFYKEYVSGIRYSFSFKFYDYKTIDIDLILSLGTDAWYAKLPFSMKDNYLSKSYNFKDRKKHLDIDGFRYQYEFYVDNIKLESYHFNIEQKHNMFDFSIKTWENAKTLRVYTGYLYTEKELKKLYGMGIGSLRNIDVKRLIKHLEKMAKSEGKGYSVALEKLEKMIKFYSNRESLKASGNVGELINFIKTWKISTDNKIELIIFLESLK